MDKDIRNALESELLYEIQSLKDVPIGSKEHSDAVVSVEKLYKIALEDVKVDCECEEKWYSRQNEEAKRKQDLLENRITFGVKIGMEFFGLVSTLAFYNLWMNRGFKFEETGTFTSSAFKGLIRNFKPTRR